MKLEYINRLDNTVFYTNNTLIKTTDPRSISSVFTTSLHQYVAAPKLAVPTPDIKEFFYDWDTAIRTFAETTKSIDKETAEIS